LAKAITDIPGNSAYFMGGVVTYSNASKIKLLGVDVATLERCGAVSEPVALRMAEGVRSLLDADIGVGITGVAGPEGGSAKKPAGTVYIAWDVQGALSVRLFQFGGIGRSAVREAAAESAIEGILEVL
jgi:PncC family amidohydrolase